jgi:hypothetical protein
MNRAQLAAIFAIGLICGTTIMLLNWDAVDKENNAFAKDCNDRGGMLIFGMYARQCIGTNSTKETK